MQVPDSFYQLVQKYLAGDASVAEEKLVNDWYHSFPETTAEVYTTDIVDEAVIANRIKEKLLSNISNQVGIKSFTFKKWWLQSAAAVFFLILSVGTYLYFSSKKVILISKEISPNKNEIKPGGNRATLTLANGTVITLDSTANGVVSQQGGTKIMKVNAGKLQYNSATTTEQDNIIAYNTISTPRGGQYQVTLPDNTNVWLNASSSIRFPTSFTRNKRTVEITGEVYFEVAKNKAMPFNVLVKNAIINVLGTHFNIMAYNNESSINTTLLEGSLQFTKGISSRLLLPGQQASLIENGSINLITNADMEETIAWKNGRFQFNGADIKTIMRQIERWYDVEVIFNGNTNLHFTGQITRSANVWEVLKKLELTNEIHFKIDGRKIFMN